MMKLLKSALICTVLLAAGAAGAQTFNFTSLTPSSGGSTGTGSGAVGCGFNSGSDICGASMTFTQGLLTATATGTYNGLASGVRVVQDYNGTTPRYVGLGVYHTVNDTSDDNVTFGEVLTLTFNQMVTLTGLKFREEGHGTYSDGTETFLFNGASKNFAGSISGLSVTGTSFTFGFGGTKPDQYYLSGMTVTAVPEPETFAMMIAGVGLIGAIARRRKAKQTA